MATQNVSFRPPSPARPLTEKGAFVTDWIRYFNQLYLLLGNNFYNNFPRDQNLTTLQINSIPDPPNGMRAYNTTTGKFVGYEGGAWVAFNTSPM